MGRHHDSTSRIQHCYDEIYEMCDTAAGVVTPDVYPEHSKQIRGTALNTKAQIEKASRTAQLQDLDLTQDQQSKVHAAISSFVKETRSLHKRLDSKLKNKPSADEENGRQDKIVQILQECEQAHIKYLQEVRKIVPHAAIAIPGQRRFPGNLTPTSNNSSTSGRRTPPVGGNQPASNTTVPLVSALLKKGQRQLQKQNVSFKDMAPPEEWRQSNGDPGDAEAAGDQTRPPYPHANGGAAAGAASASAPDTAVSPFSAAAAQAQPSAHQAPSLRAAGPQSRPMPALAGGYKPGAAPQTGGGAASLAQPANANGSSSPSRPVRAEPPSPAAASLRSAASQGDAAACLQLGLLAEQGPPGSAADLQEATQWYQKAAELGDTEGRSVRQPPRLASSGKLFVRQSSALMLLSAQH